MTEAEKLEMLMGQYREEWDLVNPAPKPQKVHAGDFLQFYLFMPVAALGPIVSAFRTYALLKDHAVLTGKWAIGEAIIGTLFFELAAIVYLMIRLRRLQSKGGMPEISLGWIGVGLFWTIGAVTVSNVVEVTVAALADASVIVPAFIPAALIGVFIGLGVPLCTIVAGETVGRFLLEIQRERQRIREEHGAALAAREETFIKSWKSQKGKRLRQYEEARHQARVGERSVFSKWSTAAERRDAIVQCVKELDPGRGGVTRKDIVELVFDGHGESQSTEYGSVSDLVKAGRLELTEDRLITWPRSEDLPF